MAVRPLTLVGFNREGGNPFLASLGLDTYGRGLQRGNDYPQGVLGTEIEKGCPPLSGLVPGWDHFQTSERQGEVGVTWPSLTASPQDTLPLKPAPGASQAPP